MKKILFFDTETTGVGLDDRIMQFGAIVGSYDEQDGKWYEERRINQYINPEKEPNKEAQKVHGITLEFTQKFNTMDKYIKEFIAYMNQCEYIVWHNVEYDWRMLQQDLKRLWLQFNKDDRLCTMKLGTDICQLPWWFNWWFKRPKLVQLHEKLFNKWFDGAHDAMADIIATKDCFLEMIKLWIVQI